MGSDMVVALKEASANGTTLFGLNHHAATGERHRLVIQPGQTCDPGALIRASTMTIPQVRQTFSFLGIQQRDRWGCVHGVNEHRVVLGVTPWRSRLTGGEATGIGPDLVRLALERSRSAHHAVEVLTDLLERHAPVASEGPAPPASDFIYLIADPNESYLLEATGRYWALLECGHSRVVTNTAMIRQDWTRLSPGLASLVIKQGWWPDDGSKIDFVRCLAEACDEARNAQKRWGRASLALAQQQGAIDAHFLRRMLADHYSGNRDMLPGGRSAGLASSLVVELPRGEQPVLAWLAFGPPKVAVYFPLCLLGEIPAAFADPTAGSTSLEERTHDLWKDIHGTERDRGKLTRALERLQTRFDQDAEEFLLKAQDCTSHSKGYQIPQLATEMMHNHVELFDREYRTLFGVAQPPSQAKPEAEEVLFYA